MRPTFRKLEVKDIANLERLVAENIEGVEPGLKVVDSRLLLGRAAIDLVGLDSNASLVLIALDFNADDGLLLRVMDAYSWCLEYPDTLRRLYPMARATSHPPRILFIVEKMTDAFLRRVKQLSFLEIDCYEFRNLEVNGASVVYFDLIEQLRKSVVEASAESRAQSPSAPAAAPVVGPSLEPQAELRIEQPGELQIEPRVDPVKPAIEWSARAESCEPVSEPKRVDPPKAVVAEPVRFEPDVPVVSKPAAPVVVSQSAPAEPVPASVVPVPVAPPTVPAPVIAEPAKVAEARVAPIDPQTVNLVSEPVMTVPPTPPVVVPAPVVVTPAPAPVEPTPALTLEAIETTSRAQTNGLAVEPEVIVAPVIEAAPRVDVPVEEPVAVTPAAPAPTAPQRAVAPATPVEPAPVQIPPVWAKPGSQPNGAKPHFFAQATKANPSADAPVPVTATAPPVRSATPPAARKVGLEVDDRPELESLSFPKDGLSRQWLEFLSQLGATK